uniref:50S ribosomal protein L4 n=1 Tax=Arachnia propionica TaxID=1750 RepID=UPI003C6F35DF
RTALETLVQLGEPKKMLVVFDRFEEVAWLSLRNVPTIHVLAVDQLNAYDVLVADSVVFTSAALAAFTHRGAEAVASESEATEPAGSAEALENEEEK